MSDRVLDVLARASAHILRTTPIIEASWRGMTIRVHEDSVDEARRIADLLTRGASLPSPVSVAELRLTRREAGNGSTIRTPMVTRAEAEVLCELSGDPFLVYFDRDQGAMTILGRSRDGSFVTVEHELPKVSVDAHSSGAGRTAAADMPNRVTNDGEHRARKRARIRPLLRCVRCSERAELIDASPFAMECVSCRSRYPVVDGTPILLVDPEADFAANGGAVSSNGYSRQAIALFADCVEGFVLDCGCGSPKDNLEQVIHLERTQYANVDVVASCDRLPFAAECLEGIVCESVLEHVPNPWSVVQEFHRALKKQGRLFVDVPFMAPYHGYPNHYQNFTDSGLASLLHRFEKLDAGIHPHQEPWVAIGWILRTVREGLADEDLKRELDRSLVGDLLGAVARGQPPRVLHPLQDSARRTIAAGFFFFGKKPMG